MKNAALKGQMRELSKAVLALCRQYSERPARRKASLWICLSSYVLSLILVVQELWRSEPALQCCVQLALFLVSSPWYKGWSWPCFEQGFSVGLYVQNLFLCGLEWKQQTEDGCNLGTIFLNPADFSDPQSWLEGKGVFTFREQKENCKVQCSLFLRNLSLVKEQHLRLLEVP